MTFNRQILLWKTSIIDVRLACKSFISRFSVLINFTMWSSNRFFCNQLFPAFFRDGLFRVQVFLSQVFLSQVFLSSGFSGSRFFWVRFFWVQVFQSPGSSGYRFFWVQFFSGSSFFWVLGLDPGFRSFFSLINWNSKWK